MDHNRKNYGRNSFRQTEEENLVAGSDPAIKELKLLKAFINFFSSTKNLQSIIVELELKDFCGGCLSFNKLINNIMKLELDIYSEHLMALQEATEDLNLEDELLLIDKFKEVLGGYIKPIEIQERKIDNRLIVEVIGKIVVISEILLHLEKKLSENPNIEEVRFVVADILHIDADLKNNIWHGKNVGVLTKSVIIHGQVIWNVSGKDDNHTYSNDAGTEEDGHGKQGKDGFPGESGGNVLILAEEIENPENFMIISNGGKGSKDQVGGNGRNCKDGKGITKTDFDEKFPNATYFNGRIESIKLRKTLTNIKDDSLKVKTIIYGGVNLNIFIEAESNQGNGINFSIKMSGFPAQRQAFLLYKGSLGQLGEYNGECGFSGQEGQAGEIIEAVNIEQKSYEEGNNITQNNDTISSSTYKNITDVESLIDNLKSEPQLSESWLQLKDIELNRYELEELFLIFEKLKKRVLENKISQNIVENSELQEVQELLIEKYKLAILQEIVNQLPPYQAVTDNIELSPKCAARYLVEKENCNKISHPTLENLNEYLFVNSSKHREKISKFCKEVLKNINNEAFECSIRAFVSEAKESEEVHSSIEKYYDEYEECLELNQGYDWRKCCNDQDVLHEYYDYIQDKGILSQSYRELLAYIFDTNIRLYIEYEENELSLLDNHNASSKKVIHVLHKANDFVELNIDENYFRLEDERKKNDELYAKILTEIESLKQKQEFDDYSKENFFSSNANQSFFNQYIKSWVPWTKHDNKKILDEETSFNNRYHLSEEQNIIEIIKYFSIEKEKQQLKERLEKISSRYIGQQDILKNIQKRFSSGGRHVSFQELSLLVNSILTSVVENKKEFNTFCWIVAAHSQRNWIDELILLQLENYFKMPLAEKSKWREYLSKINNIDILLLFNRKLDQCTPGSSISTQYIEDILYLLSSIPNETMNLEGLELSEWPYALKEKYWTYRLSKLADWQNSDISAASYYLLSTGNTFGTDLVRKFLNTLEEKKQELSPEKLTNILSNFHNENWSLGEEEVNTLHNYSIDKWVRKMQQKFTADKKENKLTGVILDTIAVSAMAAGQIAVGAATMNPIFINEGVNDLLYTARTSRSGNFSWKNYGKHKMKSAVISSATFGIAGYLSNSIKAKHLKSLFPGHVIGRTVGLHINRHDRSIKQNMHETFNSYKEENFMYFEEQREEYKIITETENHITKKYQENLLKLMIKTRNPHLFAAIIRENVPMDLKCVSACLQVIHKILEIKEIMIPGLTIVIEGYGGIIQKFSTGSEEAESVNIPLTLKNNHFEFGETSTSENHSSDSKNNCLYNALAEAITELKNVIGPEEFRFMVADIIEQNEEIRNNIQQGWHQLPINLGALCSSTREHSDRVEDSESSPFDDEVFAHLQDRFTRFFDFGGIIQRISEETNVDREQVVENGTSQHQDPSSGKGKDIHAVHVVRAGKINSKIKKQTKYKPLYKELKKLLDDTQNMPKYANEWQGVGCDIDEFQSKNLKILVTIDFRDCLSEDDAKTIRGMKEDYIALLDERINSGKLSENQNAVLRKVKKSIIKMTIEFLFEKGKKGYIEIMTKVMKK